jgi:hypothetical protein
VIDAIPNPTDIADIFPIGIFGGRRRRLGTVFDIVKDIKDIVKEIRNGVNNIPSHFSDLSDTLSSGIDKLENHLDRLTQKSENILKGFKEGQLNAIFGALRSDAQSIINGIQAIASEVADIPIKIGSVLFSRLDRSMFGNNVEGAVDIYTNGNRVATLMFDILVGERVVQIVEAVCTLMLECIPDIGTPAKCAINAACRTAVLLINFLYDGMKLVVDLAGMHDDVLLTTQMQAVFENREIVIANQVILYGALETLINGASSAKMVVEGSELEKETGDGHNNNNNVVMIAVGYPVLVSVMLLMISMLINAAFIVYIVWRNRSHSNKHSHNVNDSAVYDSVAVLNVD